jgi:hypothetical protein
MLAARAAGKAQPAMICQPGSKVVLLPSDGDYNAVAYAELKRFDRQMDDDRLAGYAKWINEVSNG